jgi:putative endonuclease
MNAGVDAELHAAQLYKHKGYSIIATNYRYYGTGRGQKAEIDIIATKNKILVCIEVKFRKSGGLINAQESITHRKLQLMQMALLDFLHNNSRYSSYAIRFDAVFCDGKDTIVTENIL